MFNFFNDKPTDVKSVRNAILQFIKEQLKKNEGGEGSNIKSIMVHINPTEDEDHVYRSAVFYDEPDRFKNEEIQKIADDFDIKLPPSWKLELVFNSEIPKGSITAKQIPVSLLIVTNKTFIQSENIECFIKSLNGKTEKEQYAFKNVPGKVNIGREIKSQTADGFFRTNQIAFIEAESNPENRSVSRQHAHLEWRPEQRAFYLFADEGGIPPQNKLKVRSENGILEKIQTIEMGHRLMEGDQIILGEQAVLEFSYKKVNELI